MDRGAQEKNERRQRVDAGREQREEPPARGRNYVMEQARRGQDQKPRRDRLDCACCAPEREISKRRARVGEDRRQRKRQRRRQRNGRRKTYAPDLRRAEQKARGCRAQCI